MALEGGEGSGSRPGRYLPPGKTLYPLYRKLGGPQGRSGQVQKISPPPGIDSRTVQLVAGRYTDYRPLAIGGYPLNRLFLNSCRKNNKLDMQTPETKYGTRPAGNSNF